jgi:mitogen-activated protein kinase kinase kinase
MRPANSFPTVPGIHTPISTNSSSASSSTSPDSLGNKPLPNRSTDVFSRFQRKFRQEDETPALPSHQRALSDSGSEDDRPSTSTDTIITPQNGTGVTRPSEAPLPSLHKEIPVFINASASQGVATNSVLTEAQVANLTTSERERLEWQAMLTSVLDGEVFRSEKTRIVIALDQVDADKDKDARQDIWLGLRAWLRGRTVKEERIRLADRRERVVGAVHKELMKFCVSNDPDPTIGEPIPAISQVLRLLERFDVAASLYPSLRAMGLDKPQIATEENKGMITARLEALISWSKLHYSLHQQLDSLRRWTGSDTLDVKQPTLSADVRVVGEPASHGKLTSFIDRILKEDSLVRTFEKGTLVTLHALIENAREIIINHSPMFRILNLPLFEDELVQLISFPTKLIKASLQARLLSARRVKDPNLMVLETMTEDFRLAIALACTLKREYEAQVEEDSGGHWKLPPCIPAHYDSVLLESVLLFFKLLHWRLKSGTKAIYFKETDVLEAQEDIMDEVSITIENGASLVAEQLW